MPRRLHFRPGLRPDLSADLILGWADAFHAAAGRWPRADDGPVGFLDTTWAKADQALRKGYRGLPGGSSLARLLRDERGARHRRDPPALAVPHILAWCDAHRRLTGGYPLHTSGPVAGAPGETWAAVDDALRVGRRGLPGGSSLARLLHARRGVPNHLAAPALTPEQVLGWADAHHARTGGWPTPTGGAIPGAGGDTWGAVDDALRAGRRGLPGGSSLARLLAERRGARNPAARPPLTADRVLAWADAHHARTGGWPTAASGPVDGAGAETWRGADNALRRGRRGLPGGSSLTRLLAARRGVRNPAALPPLTADRVLAWADAHHARTGGWPTAASGPVADAPGEAWGAVDHALKTAGRGLPAGGSLARLLAAHRGARTHLDRPPLTPAAILGWADAHYRRAGAWPHAASGPIPGGTAWPGCWGGGGDAEPEGPAGPVGGRGPPVGGGAPPEDRGLAGAPVGGGRGRPG